MTKKVSKNSDIKQKNNMKLIVIRVTNYEDNDILCDCISEEGPICVQVKGGQDSKNKNSGFCGALNICDATFIEGNYTNKILRSFVLLQSPMKAESSLEYLSSALVIQELTKNCLSEDDKKDLYSYLYDIIITLKQSKDPYMVALLYFAFIVKTAGFSFEINKCVVCGSKKNIKAFSFVAGGFVCADCLTDDTDCRLTPDQMMLLRDTFSHNEINFVSNNYSKENALALFNELAIFVEDNLGTNLKSIKLIK